LRRNVIEKPKPVLSTEKKVKKQYNTIFNSQRKSAQVVGDYTSFASTLNLSSLPKIAPTTGTSDVESDNSAYCDNTRYAWQPRQISLSEFRRSRDFSNDYR
jgi:hypothetical protein